MPSPSSHTSGDLPFFFFSGGLFPTSGHAEDDDSPPPSSWSTSYTYMRLNSPRYDTNLPVSHMGHHISQIKSSFELFCALVWNVAHFLLKTWIFHIHSTVSGAFLQLFYSHWQRLFLASKWWSWILTVCTSCKSSYRARSIQPKFPEISVQNSMDQFGPTGKVSKKQVHLLRWSSFPGRTGLNFGWMDRAHNVLSHSHIYRGEGGVVVKTRESPDFRSLEVGIST